MHKTELFWDKISKNYDQQANKDQSYKKTLEIIKKYLKSSDIVLDVGCATGLYAIEFSKHVKEIHGLDISPKMIERAKRKAAEANMENVDFKQTTLFDESYQKASFDVILALDIIHLVEDSQKHIQRISELVKTGGFIISSTPCLGEKKTFQNKLSSIAVFLLLKFGILPYIRFFKIQALEDLISNENFQIITTETMINNTATNYLIIAKKMN